jgi:hypothetical protein
MANRGAAAISGHRRDVDDHPGSSSDHALACLAAAEEGASQVDILHQLPLLIRRLNQLGRRERTRIVNPNVEPPERFICQRGKRRYRFGTADIERRTYCLDLETAAHISRDVNRALLVEIADHEVSADLCQPARDRPTDSPSATGDHRGLAAQRYQVSDGTRRQFLWPHGHLLSTLGGRNIPDIDQIARLSRLSPPGPDDLAILRYGRAKERGERSDARTATGRAEREQKTACSSRIEKSIYPGGSYHCFTR